MKTINISDQKKRDAKVRLANRHRASAYHYANANQQDVDSLRVIKNTIATDLSTLTKDASLEDLSQQLIDGDPELDLEVVGKKVWGTSRLFLTEANQPAAGVTTKEVVYNPAGELVEERDFIPVEANINTELPLMWSGKLMPKKECIKRFVFVNAMQLQHSDGLTFDFLFNMAKELEAQNAMLFLGAGKKSNQPLVLSRNGKQYRAFLEGRTSGEKYQLILHLTNMEMKAVGGEG